MYYSSSNEFEMEGVTFFVPVYRYN